MEQEFEIFLQNFIKIYKTDIFNNIPKCKSLLLDLSKGEYKSEIRLLLQALELGCHTTILSSKDLNITRISLINQLKNEYFISEDISVSLMDILLLELRNYKSINTKQQSLNTEKQEQVLPKKIIKPNNSTSLDIDKIINSLIDDKEKLENNRISFFNQFRDEIEPLCISAFDEYKNIMSEKKLNCRYYTIEHELIIFEFSFYKKSYEKSPLSYIVTPYKNKNIYLIGTGTMGVDNYDLKNLIRQQHEINNFTKQLIFNDLLTITKFALK